MTNTMHTLESPASAWSADEMPELAARIGWDVTGMTDSELRKLALLADLVRQDTGRELAEELAEMGHGDAAGALRADGLVS